MLSKYLLGGVILGILLVPMLAKADPTYVASDAGVNDPTFAFDNNYTSFTRYIWFYGETGHYTNMTFMDYVGSNATYTLNVSGVCGEHGAQISYNRFMFGVWNGTDFINYNVSDCMSGSIISDTVVLDDAQMYVNASGDLLLRVYWDCDDGPPLYPCGSDDGSLHEIQLFISPTPPTPPTLEQYPILAVIPIVIVAFLLLNLVGMVTSGVFDVELLIITSIASIVAIIMIGVLYVV